MRTSTQIKSLVMGTSFAAILSLAGCGESPTPEIEIDTPPAAVEEAAVEETVVEAISLADILAGQPDEVQARYGARHPAETLDFFGIEPGMTVVEALPGGGWYSKILLAYLGPEGTLIGGHYPDDLWASFGFGEEWTAKRVEGTANWPVQAAEWGVENRAGIASNFLTDLPDGSADAVLFIRALHNLNRFNPDGGYLDSTLRETFDALKPGGIVGIVQHRSPEENGDEWADGSNGYLKQSQVIATFEAAGFELADQTEVNANALDVPTEADFVWRLKPSLIGTEEDTPERAEKEAIGESDRMTLKFIKPA